MPWCILNFWVMNPLRQSCPSSTSAGPLGSPSESLIESAAALTGLLSASIHGISAEMEGEGDILRRTEHLETAHMRVLAVRVVGDYDNA